MNKKYDKDWYKKTSNILKCLVVFVLIGFLIYFLILFAFGKITFFIWLLVIIGFRILAKIIKKYLL